MASPTETASSYHTIWEEGASVMSSIRELDRKIASLRKKGDHLLVKRLVEERDVVRGLMYTETSPSLGSALERLREFEKQSKELVNIMNQTSQYYDDVSRLQKLYLYNSIIYTILDLISSFLGFRHPMIAPVHG